METYTFSKFSVSKVGRPNMVCAPPNLKVGGLGPTPPPPASYAPA